MRTVTANTIRKKLISTSISAIFMSGVAPSNAADVGAGATISSDTTSSYSFNQNNTVLEIDATGGNVTLTGSVTRTTSQETGSLLRFNTGATTNTAKLAGSINQGGITNGGVNVSLSGSNASGIGEITGTANINTITFTGNGTIKIGGSATVTDAVDNTSGTAGRGILFFSDNATVYGNIGSTHSLAGITLSGAGTSYLSDNGTIRAGYVDLAGATTTLMLTGTALTGNITTSNNGQGTLRAVGTTNIQGNVGAPGGNALASVSVEGDLAISGTVNSQNVHLMTGRSVFIGGTATIGSVTLQSDNTGAFTFGGDATVAGNIGGDKKLATLNLNGDINTRVNLLGNVNANTIHIASNGNLDLTGANTVVANITTATNGTGGVHFIGTDGGTFTGDLGTSALRLDGVGISRNVIVNGNIYSTNTGVKFVADKILTIGSGYSVTAPVITATTNTGILTFSGSTTTGGAIGDTSGNKLKAVNFNGGTVSAGHDIAASDINFSGSSTTTFTGNRTLTGFVQTQNTASIDVGRTTLTITGPLSLNSGTTLKTELYDTGSDNATGKINATSDGAFVSSNAKLDVNVTSTRTVNDGQKFLLIDGKASDGQVDAITTITDNSAVLNFTTTACLHGTSTCAATGGDDLYLIAHRVGGGYVTAASLPSSSPATAAANTLNSIAEGGTATGDMATVINTLNSHDAATLSGALKKAAPIANAATTSASFAAATGGLNTVTTRLAVVRGESQMANTGAMTGLAAGDAAQSRNFWMKGFGAWNKAGIRDGFDGYKAKSSGLSFGADTEITNGWTAGGALTYAVTSVDQQDTRVGDATQIKSYQLTGYAMKDFGPTYLDAMLSFARHNNKTHRATALARTANGNFDGDQWTARLAGGYRMPLGGKTQLVPLASLEWSTLKQKAYTEKGAGALNLSYQAQTTDSLKLGLGARITGETTWGAATVIPEAHAMTFHDFGDARTDTTASFTGGGAAFTTTGQAIQRNSYNLGGSLAFLTGRTSKVTVGYDFEGRKGFAGHSAQITGRWMF